MTARFTQTLALGAVLVVVIGCIALFWIGVPSPQRDIKQEIPRTSWACFKQGTSPKAP